MTVDREKIRRWYAGQREDAAPKPILAPSRAKIPQAMRDATRWVVWKQIGRAGKTTKVPFQTNGVEASSTDPATWTDFETAWAASSSAAGIGFVLGDGWFGVDQDDSLDNAAAIPSYTEQSPGGNGLKTICFDPDFSMDRGRRFGNVEIYANGRYFAITGLHWLGTPETVEPCSAEVSALVARLDVQKKSKRAPSLTAEERAWKYIEKMPDAVSGQGGHDRTFEAACVCVRFDLDESAMWRIMHRFNDLKTAGEHWSDAELAHKIKSACERAAADRGKLLNESKKPVSNIGTALGQRDPDTGRLILSPKRTLPTAEAFLHEFYSHDDGPALTTYAGVAYAWRNNRHEPIEEAALNNQLYPWLHDALRFTKSDGLIDFEANPTTVNQARQSILDHAYIASDLQSPCWIKPRSVDLPAHEVLPCRSSNLHLPTGIFSAPTPRLFVTSSLDFDYDPEAPVARQWEQFLLDVFEGDIESIVLLQQWFGYCLTANTRLQKMLLLIGPKRSGKGTIARVLGKLIGEGNVAGPTTSSLAEQFGLQDLIGKSVAIVSDARFGGPDASTVVERLLCISGEDKLSVPRKFLGAIALKLGVRMVFLSNETPRLSDASGALAGRFVVLHLKKSWYGHEDAFLTDKLIKELPGILKWAIEGWHMLREQGYFSIPASSKAITEEIEDAMSPMGAFVRERCVVDQDHRIYATDLFEAWKAWCKDQGRAHAGTVQSFGRDVRAVLPSITTGQNVARFYKGITTQARLAMEMDL